MKKYTKKICITFCFIAGISSLWGQTNDTSQQIEYKRSAAVFYDINYKGDVAANLCGGIQKGITYLGYAQWGIGLDVERLGWWKGGKLFVKGANTHGGGPTEQLVGDYQVVDNIETGDYTYLQEFWFEQQFGNITVKAGLQDFNADFAVCEAAQLFLNSSFGVHSALSSNMTLPIFPTTAWALNVDWSITPIMSLMAGVFDSPIDLEENPRNLTWRFTKEKGCIAAVEYRVLSNINDRLPGRYTVGFTYHTAEKEYGAHLSAMQSVWVRNNRSLNLFLMSALSEKDRDNNHFHLGGGVTCTGVFSSKGRDEAGLGVTAAFLASAKKHETTIELTYRYRVHDNIYLQPNLQYIINPAGTGAHLKNALFTAIRTEIQL